MPDKLHPIWWRGQQWAVTSYGIECLDGMYAIQASRLDENTDEHSWLAHMYEKNWVNRKDFATVWLIGLVLHGVITDAAIVRKAVRKALRVTTTT